MSVLRHFFGGEESYLPDRARIIFVVASLVYAGAISYAYLSYLYPVWGYYGFTYSIMDSTELFYGLALLIPASLLLPLGINRPSATILLLMYVIVYIPTLVVSLTVDSGGIEDYWHILLALTISMQIASIVSRLSPSCSLDLARLPDKKLRRFLLIGWVVLALICVGLNYDVMSLVSFENIYTQRELGASSNALSAYSQTIFSNVFSPALLVLGLLTKRRWYLILGLTGSVIIYSIAAQRTFLLLPIVLFGFFLIHRNLKIIKHTSSISLFLLSAVTFFAARFYEESALAESIAGLLVFRTLCLPGLTFTQYYDLFSRFGYTWWSHVKGLDFFIDAPAAYSETGLWPGLGYIVGLHVYNRPDVNANANLFAGDGLAAAGWFGVIIIGVLFSMWLFSIDRLALKWNYRFVVMSIFTPAVALTNGHFFTTLLSFGGILWMFVFFFFRPAHIRQSRALR